MTDSLYVAWRYVVHGKARTVTLVACVSLIAALPLALQVLVGESERQLVSRAASTPLLLGAKGSALDLVMASLYFAEEVPEEISLADAEGVLESDLAAAVPVHVGFQARGHPVVGTSLEYLDLRGLRIDRGRPMAVLGEAVLGAEVARRLELGPGDSLVSDPGTLFDLAGAYPLKMRVVGVLERAHSPDDLAVLVDVKTAWVMAGLGHGHQDLATTTDRSVVLERSEKAVVANAKLVQYTKIDETNIGSFHFHGDSAGYPLTAVIVAPRDERAGAILRGRYLADGETRQILEPAEIVEGLMQEIFRVESVLEAVIVVVGSATGLALVLVFALSLRLRSREFETVFKLGGRRSTVARLVAAEIAIIVAASAIACALVVLATRHAAEDLVRMLFIG